ncbi:MAG: hypothetical protein ACLU21_08060, partial [Angelakisella sp.]
GPWSRDGASIQRSIDAGARMLFDNIEDNGEESIGPQEVILQPKLKIRRSCGNTKPIYELFG